jgi:asparagine synthase (glutamine-hydrolysing)
MRCPVGLKLNNLQDVIRINENEPGNKRGKYFLKTSDGKQILRDMMRNMVPQDIADGVKQGFSAPDASWFKGESIDYVRKQLMTGSPRIYGFLDREATCALVNEHLSGEQNRRLFIWSLLNVENWLAATYA